MKTLAAVVLLLYAAISLQAQSSPEVVIAGNSIALFEGTLQQYIFPTLDPSLVHIFGHEGLNCSHVEMTIESDVFGPQYSWTPEVAVLIDTTNDWYHTPMTPPAQLVGCLRDTINLLLGHERGLQIVLLNTPPYVPSSEPCYEQQDLRWLIEDYNAAIPELQSEFPNNVTVIDVFTPFEMGMSGYANPTRMVGACGIHPGQQNTWDVGQAILAATYRCTVLQLLGMSCS